jgi:hypothetical protein
MKVGEGGAKSAVENPHTVLVGSGVRLGRVVGEVVSEEFLEDIEVPTALNFFGVPADDGLRGFARFIGAHW